MDSEIEIPSRSDLDRKAALNRARVRRHREKDPEGYSEYQRQWRAKNREKKRQADRRRYWTLKALRHLEQTQSFEADRRRETQRHLQMKAAQLRRSIMRDGVIAEHEGWDWDFDGMIDHLAVVRSDDH